MGVDFYRRGRAESIVVAQLPIVPLQLSASCCL